VSLLSKAEVARLDYDVSPVNLDSLIETLYAAMGVLEALQNRVELTLATMDREGVRDNRHGLNEAVNAVPSLLATWHGTREASE